MASMIQTRSMTYYANGTPEEVKAALDQGRFVDVWWFAAWGQRYAERAWFAADAIEMVRSESDDG